MVQSDWLGMTCPRPAGVGPIGYENDWRFAHRIHVDGGGNCAAGDRVGAPRQGELNRSRSSRAARFSALDLQTDGPRAVAE